MTLKAVHLYRSIRMTFLAELARRVDWNKLPRGILLGMTGDTPDQAVFGVTRTKIHGFITLVEKHLRMVPSHLVKRLNTAFTPDRLREVQNRLRRLIG